MAFKPLADDLAHNPPATAVRSETKGSVCHSCLSLKKTLNMYLYEGHSILELH